jgi:thymidine kinase
VGDAADGTDTAADGAAVAYEVLCRRHHRAHVTRLAAHAGLAETLPFEPDS